MAKSPTAEFFATLKTYANKLSEGERTPAEIATALNDWAHESAESVKARIHDEVEAAVLKMGFVKREEFYALAKEVAALKKGSSASKVTKKAVPKKSALKKSTVKKAAAKKSVSKKAVKR